MDISWPGGRTVRKMWASFDKAMCGLFSPAQIRREGMAHADAQRYAALLGAQTEKDVAAIKSGYFEFEKGRLAVAPPPPPQLRLPHTEESPLPSGAIVPALSEFNMEAIKRRVEGKVTADELQKALNLQRILARAEGAAAAAGDEGVSDDPIEDSWFSQWREHAEKVSETTMQDLWGRLLKDEAASPGAVPLAAMACLSIMGKREAEAVLAASPFLLDDFFWRGSGDELYKQYSFGRFMELQDLGLVSGVEAIGLRRRVTSNSSDNFQTAFVAGTKIIMGNHSDPSRTFDLPILRLSAAGRTIFRLAQTVPHSEYIQSFAKHLFSEGLSVTIADIVSKLPDGRVSWANGVEIK